ncbi:MAG: hypothetical protein M3P84_09955 [Chloroflexota bacterium]|nr:hypothetical protein [Chloroflexota bacterium]
MRVRGRRPKFVLRRPGRIARGGSRALVLFVAMTLVACNGASDRSLAPSESAVPSAVGSASPAASPGDSPSVEPLESPSPDPSDLPSGSPGSVPTPTAGGTGACLGSTDTRGFFGSFAKSVSWPVYCAVLPKGWSVEKGNYRLKDGGRLTITYRRRADSARVVLDEGTVCIDTSPCVPAGTSLGTGPFGDRQAEFRSTGVGLAAVVDASENPAWLLTASGLTEREFRTITANLHLLDQ